MSNKTFRVVIQYIQDETYIVEAEDEMEAYELATDGRDPNECDIRESETLEVKEL